VGVVVAEAEGVTPSVGAALSEVVVARSEAPTKLPEGDAPRETVDWKTLEKCPECHSTELRHDATCGETDCVTCGWSMEWAR
jgi:hypothetical protein